MLPEGFKKVENTISCKEKWLELLQECPSELEDIFDFSIMRAETLIDRYKDEKENLYYLVSITDSNFKPYTKETFVSLWHIDEIESIDELVSVSKDVYDACICSVYSGQVNTNLYLNIRLLFKDDDKTMLQVFNISRSYSFTVPTVSKMLN